MVYDTVRQTALVFGGYLADVIEFAGNPGTWVTAPGRRDWPPGQGQHAMAYDTARGVTVLFGGHNSGGDSSETWEWNGAAWTQPAVSGPSPRAFAK